jgi:predicted RNase H-like nuclease
VELFDARKRLPYKASKVRSYWPEAFPADRRTRLYSQWREIAARLEREIAGVEAVLPPLEATSKAWEIKAYEDTLDAIVCAWVAICALEGRAMPFGDENAAIWIPTSFSRSCQDRRSGEKWS